MKLAQVTRGHTVVRDITAFGGLNLTDDVRDGELAECENLSTRRYPYLAPREKREPVATYENASAYYCFDGHTVVCANGRLLFDGEDKCAVTDGEKQFCAVGRQLVVFPDKLMLDADTGAVVQMDASVSYDAAVLADATVCFPRFRESGRRTELDSRAYTYAYRCSMAQFAAAWDGVAWDFAKIAQYRVCGQWIETSGGFSVTDLDGNPITLANPREPEPTERYNAQGRFIRVGSTLTPELELTGAPSFAAAFAVGDTVELDGRWVIDAIDDEENTLTLTDADFDAETRAVTVQRDVPDLDFICEHQNRLWGASNATRTVYASALGEPTKFWLFDGVSTDSYQLAVGGEGDFTAICSYGGAVCLFRERKLHKVLGGYPAEYYLSTRDVSGVQAGCCKSFINVGGVLYYWSVGGAMRFTGSTAECVSKKLGEVRLSAVRGGTDGRRCYFATDGGVLVYDTETGLWLREDGAGVTDFAFAGELRMLVGDTVYRVGGGAPDADFSARLVPFSERAFAQKRYARLSIEAELGAGAFLTVEARQDGGAWRAVGTLAAETAGVRVLRLAPMRCGKLELRLVGKGDVAVLALRRRFEARSERE